MGFRADTNQDEGRGCRYWLDPIFQHLDVVRTPRRIFFTRRELLTSEASRVASSRIKQECPIDISADEDRQVSVVRSELHEYLD